MHTLNFAHGFSIWILMYAIELFMSEALQSEWVWWSSDGDMWEEISFTLVVLLWHSLEKCVGWDRQLVLP